MEATLIVDIQSDWHPGTGRGSGFHLDALSHTGADGLPRLPGRTLKGLLRDALWRAEQWDWAEVPPGTTERLFGSWTNQDVLKATAREADAEQTAQGDAPKATERDANWSRPGALRVGDACLPKEVADYLGQGKEGEKLVAGLYREHFSTAIEHASGVAKSRSLRGMQVVVPLTLAARLSVMPGAKPPENWRATLAAVLPLITAVGAHRSRGFGRARLTLEEGASDA